MGKTDPGGGGVKDVERCHTWISQFGFEILGMTFDVWRRFLIRLVLYQHTGFEEMD
jgi:hypothetical protein